MKILVGVIANDSARYSLFSSCVTKLDLDGLDADVEWLIGGDWCGARNDLVQMTLEEDYTHLWFMDDDHAFPPGLLKKLARHDVPLVNPLCLARIAPFPLVTYAETPPELAHLGAFLPVDLNGAPETGLIELAAGGCAGMLIRRDVLEAMPPPWFEYTDRSEDIVFCEKARALGFKLYADLECKLGHITTAVVWPAVQDGKWMTGITVGRDLNLFVSAASEWEEVADEAAVGEDEGAAEVAPVEKPPEPEPPAAAEPPAPGVDTAERIEMWYILEDQRWYGRVLGQDGHVIAMTGSHPQEAELLAEAAMNYPNVTVFQLQSELDDSRTPIRYGPPVRLWSREPQPPQD